MIDFPASPIADAELLTGDRLPRQSGPAKMTSYRYLNRDRTLVLRDDHVIAWDPAADQPAEPQPSGAQGELQAWKDAGSPKPMDMPPSVQGPMVALRPKQVQTIIDEELTEIEAAIPKAPNLDALREQVAALAKVVHRVALHFAERPGIS